MKRKQRKAAFHHNDGRFSPCNLPCLKAHVRHDGADHGRRPIHYKQTSRSYGTCMMWPEMASGVFGTSREAV